MADEKKAVQKEVASKGDKKVEKKAEKSKKPSKFSPKNFGKAIARFFKDLRGETKKIVWPGRQMVLKSTGIVLAAILVIGAGIWILDFALSGGITALTRIAENTTEVTEQVDSEETEEKNKTEESDEESEEETSEEASDESKAE